MVIKSGEVVWSVMGDANGSHIGAEPVIHRPMWGSYGKAVTELGVTFTSKLAMEAETEKKLGVSKRFVQIKNVRSLGKRNMLHNDALPEITVDAQTFEVYANGKLLDCEPATEVPLAQRYQLR